MSGPNNDSLGLMCNQVMSQKSDCGTAEHNSREDDGFLNFVKFDGAVNLECRDESPETFSPAGMNNDTSSSHLCIFSLSRSSEEVPVSTIWLKRRWWRWEESSRQQFDPPAPRPVYSAGPLTERSWTNLWEKLQGNGEKKHLIVVQNFTESERKTNRFRNSFIPTATSLPNKSSLSFLCFYAFVFVRFLRDCLYAFVNDSFTAKHLPTNKVFWFWLDTGKKKHSYVETCSALVFKPSTHFYPSPDYTCV